MSRLAVAQGRYVPLINGLGSGYFSEMVLQSEVHQEPV